MTEDAMRMRTRSSIAYTIDGAWNQSKPLAYFDPNPPSAVSGRYVNKRDVSTEELMTDKVTPGFFSKSKTPGAVLPVNPMTKQEFVLDDYNLPRVGYSLVSEGRSAPKDTASFIYDGDFVFAHAHGTSVSGSWSSLYKNAAIQIHDALPPLDSHYVNQVAIEGLARARSSGFDLGTFLAEFSKTLDLFKRFSRNVERRANRISNLHHVNTLREFQSAWLETRYGWRILMFEYQELKNSIDKLTSGEATPIVRGTAYREFLDSEITSTSLSTGTNSFDVNPHSWDSIADVTKVHKAGHSVRAGSAVRALTRGLGFVDPVVTVGEIIPFHLLVNFFFNTKNNLEAFSPFAAGELLWSFTTVRQFASYRFTAIPKPYVRKSTGFWWYEASMTPTTTELPFVAFSYSTVNRQPSKPYFDVSYRLNLDLGKILDLVFILGGVVRRLRRLAYQRLK